MLKDVFALLAVTSALLFAEMSQGMEPEVKKLRGVVTYHLIPAKIMRVNEIVKNPEPGTSYIGSDGILIEYEGNLDVMANWSVVDVEFFRYERPKTIRYNLFGEQHEVDVDYHAKSVVVDGDVSQYIEQ